MKAKKFNKKVSSICGLITLIAAIVASSFSPAYADWKDVPYANISSAQKLDIYLPSTGSVPFPVIVSIHGGAFMSGDKADGQEKAALMARDSGYAVASINYRLSSEAIFPAQIQDVKAAIRFLRANASQYNLNPDKIAVWGGSSGGNLASLAGTSGDVAILEDLTLGNESYSSRVQAVVDWFGPINFSNMDIQFLTNEVPKKMPGTTDAATSPESKLIGAAVGTNPELVAKANPETYITSDDPPFFIEHGTADGNIPTQQSRDFYANLIKVLPVENVTLTILEGAGHGGDAFNSAENVAKVVAFLDKYLKVTNDNQSDNGGTDIASYSNIGEISTDFKFNIPCAKYDSLTYKFTMNYAPEISALTPNAQNGLWWKLDMTSLNILSESVADCFSIGDDLKIDIYAQYAGISYLFSMKHSNDYPLLWYMDISTLKTIN